MSPKPLIQLYDAGGMGVIILFPSGVIYSNQVGGTSCLQPKAEGVYVPLVSEVINQEKLLLDYFTGPKWGGSCSSGIDDKDADAIDHILSLYVPTSFIKVNRHRLDEACEAWVYVDIATQPPERPISFTHAGSEIGGTGVTASGKVLADVDYELGVMMYPFYGFGKCTGILTWQNSD